MMQRVVDNVLGIAKESIKTITQESFNNTVKLINGFSALLLAVLPGRSVMEGVQGWELRPTFRAPRLPRWMEEGVSSFNQFIDEYETDDELDADSDCASSGVEDDDSSIPPSSPCSISSRRSNGAASRHDKNVHFLWWLRCILRFFTWPLRWLFGVTGPSRAGSRMHSRSSSAQSLNKMYFLSRHNSSIKDFGGHDAPNRRRGVIEDLQLLIELSIEKVFDVVRVMFYPVFSPLETLKLVVRKIVFGDSQYPGGRDLVPAATLGNADPASSGRYQSNRSLNTDARTCEDVITNLGYPYEALRVTTPDGHVLLLERIPRRQSRKALYLQHGLLDSSLGWVSNGVVGSQAFAAYDQGYDVYLGNLRGLASREHVNKHISPQRYWRYSVNEHGTFDIPSTINKIHEIKKSELQQLETNCDGVEAAASSAEEDQPYKLCAVAHSLGGAALLMYVVTRRLEGKPHRLSRLILLSPAGFHEKAPPSCTILQYALPILEPVLRPFVPGFYIPTKFFRMLFNKLARDFQNYPALGGLVQIFVSYFLGGDSSNWVGAIGLSHYNMDDMPGVAYNVTLHLAQMMRTKRFIMYDFGSAAANMEAYGTPYPLDIGANYGVIDIPVDVVAGRRDRLIPKSMVMKHYHTLKASGVQASYEEFEYAHLDFTFSHREELLAYVMSRLLLVTPQPRSRRSNSGRMSKNLSRKESKRQGSEKPLLENSKEKEQVIDDHLPSLKPLNLSGQMLGFTFQAKKSENGADEVSGPSFRGQSFSGGFGKSPSFGSSGSSSRAMQDASGYISPVGELPASSPLTRSTRGSDRKGNAVAVSRESSGEFENEVGSKLFGSSSFFAFPASHVASAMATAAKRAGVRKMDENGLLDGLEISSSAVHVSSSVQRDEASHDSPPRLRRQERPQERA